MRPSLKGSRAVNTSARNTQLQNIPEEQPYSKIPPASTPSPARRYYGSKSSAMDICGRAVGRWSEQRSRQPELCKSIIALKDMVLTLFQCDRLTASLSREKVFKKLNPGYTLENIKYWSSTCMLKPSCIVVPQSSSDVSTAVKILTTNNCQFAIRGGGHTANPGWAGTNSGVLISLSKLNTIKLSEDKASVVIGAGNRWGDVYAKIGEHGVTVTGGRISSVGVSGFLLGGGLSFLMHKEGFAANNVLSYEIVLANGTVATVTKTSAGDLFKALKGGTGNFGIASSFTLQ
ncbi:unnamed protein product, partial [Rhizoctonia solani]